MERVENLSVFLFVICIALIPAIIFAITMQKTMNAVAPTNRKIPPVAVWLLLLPIPIVVNIIWLIIPFKFSQSIENELRSRGILHAKYPTLYAGLAVGITQVIAYLPFMHWFTRYAWFIFFLFYWYKVAEYRRKLTDSQVPEPA